MAAPPQVLTLRAGSLTVFVAPDVEGQPGPRTPVITLDAPAVVALEAPPAGWRWELGRGLGCDTVAPDPTEPERSIRDAVARTIDALGERLRPSATPPAERVVRLASRPTYIAAGRTAVVEQLAWARPVEGRATLIGRTLPADGAPLPPRLALEGGRYTVVAADPLEAIDVDRLVHGVSWLMQCAATESLRWRRSAEERDLDRVHTGPRRDARVEAHGVELLAAELTATRPLADPAIGALGRGAGDPLFTCAARVARWSGLEVVAPATRHPGREGTAAITAIALASRLYVRRVSLLGRWWDRPTVAVLGFRPDGDPVALIPSGASMAAVAADGEVRTVDAALAARLLDTGFVFSAPVDDEPVSAGTLIKVAGAGRLRLAVPYLLWAAVIAAFGMAVPRASGVVFGEIIPEADHSRLWWLTAILVVAALVTLPLHLAFSMARTRVETPASFDVQRRLFGRILRTPASSVSGFGVGTVSARIAGLEAARDQFDTSVLAALPALLSAALAGLLLLYFEPALALVGLVVGFACLVTAAALASVVARRQRELAVASGLVTGFLLHVLLAIPGLRVAAAEPRAFLAWAEHFRHAVGQRARRASANLAVFAAMIPTLGTLALFAGVTAIGPDGLDIGVFMAFQTTYAVFLSGVIAMVSALSVGLSLRPVLEQAAELAAAPIESSASSPDPGVLRGAVAFADVTFGYRRDSRPVLDGLSLRVDPGELVAIAGPSGCGKSTMVRLLLGFEHPESGSVLYDDQDLTSLDVEAVRRQLGVVLQDGQLVPGTVRENITGVATLSDAEVWELAALVALDADIKAMPMGLDTVVGLNGGAFSGGQRQRLSIARALANRPRVLLLDEATSALDNVTQRIITDNLAQLGMTRIVVAHRLSTMVGADRICMLEGGRIVEQGTYDELMARRGRFHALAARQLLG